MDTLNIVSGNHNGEYSSNELLKDISPIYISGRRSAWKEKLIKLICSYCGCSFLSERDNVRLTKYYLIGRRMHIAAARAMWDLLSDHIHDSALAYGQGEGRTIINSYCIGFVDGLEESVKNSPYSYHMLKNEREATHYAKLINYSAIELQECSQPNTDKSAYQLGKSHGQLIKLPDISYLQ